MLETLSKAEDHLNLTPKIESKFFVGIPVSKVLADLVNSYQVRHSDWPVNWLSPEQLHLTLVAPWSGDDPSSILSRLEEFMVSDLATEIFHQLPTLEFSKVGIGPNRFAPRLIWAEGRPPVPLLELKNRLEQVLTKPDNRFYRLHLTLARFRPQDLIKEGESDLPDLTEKIDWPEKIDRVALYQSIFHPDRVDYLKLKEFRFIS